MAAYLDLAGFKQRTVMPSPDVDEVEAAEPGFLDRMLLVKTAWINDQLARRYAVPFVAPIPETVLDWLTRLVTPLAYWKRGINPSDAQYDELLKDADGAKEDIKDAADSNVGHFDLPVRQDLTASGIVRGMPQVYAEQSPYTFTDVQWEAVKNGGQ